LGEIEMPHLASSIIQSAVARHVLKVLRDLSYSSSPKTEFERRRIHSNAVVSIGYDQRTRTLQVEYYNGFVYEAYELPPDTHKKLIQSRCFDAAYRNLIKEGMVLCPVGHVWPLFG
jgi:hypothetical protein|tara:strand:- start:468 stop:815 length:348 start_codon:yes stop_codon:yes gene_type:complete